MPPKKDKKQEKGEKKAFEKQKQKIAEDKTFGLKNKNKSKSVQKFIKGVQQAAKGNAALTETQLLQRDLAQKEEKKKQLQQAALLASLFKGTENVQRIAVEDAKKFDPAAIKQDQLIDIYTDQREQKKETMEDWDQAKLEEVIKTKHGSAEVKATDIVCKFFLDALEKRQYGWFWSCPSGGDTCKYRHCLPPGYVLKRDTTKDDVDEDDAEPLENVIEQERAALKGEGTKVTLESFQAWKLKKEQERLDNVEAARVAESKKTGGRGLTVMSGRDLFTFDPSLFVDDAAAADEDDYEEDEEYWQQVLKDNQATVDQANQEAMDRSDDDESEEEDSDEEEEEDEDDAAGASSSNQQTSSSVQIGNKNLFLDGDDPELDELDD